jgi:hypothetical protein
VTAFSITGNGLFIKTGSGDEHGLGMTGESDHEIEPGEFVQVNVSNLIKAGLTSAVLTFGSVQPGRDTKSVPPAPLGVTQGTVSQDTWMASR